MVALVLADAVTLGELFGVNDRHGHCFESELDTIGNGSLHPIEEKETAQKHEQDGGGGNQKDKARRLAVARNGPAEAVNDSSHGIEAVEPAPARGNERRGVGDGRGEHPELGKKRHNVADVTIKSVKRGKPEADAESREER